MQVRIDSCCTTLTDSRTSLSAIDAIHIDLRAFIYTLHLDATSLALNQYGVSRDVGYAIGNTFRLGLLIYPAERSCCRFRVVVARLGGIDADVIGHTQLHLISASSLDVRIGYGVLADGTFCSAAKRQFSILIADGRLLALLRSWCVTTARSFFNKQEVFPTISCLVLIYSTLRNI